MRSTAHTPQAAELNGVLNQIAAGSMVSAAATALPSREELKKRRDEMARILGELDEQIRKLIIKRNFSERLINEIDLQLSEMA